MAQIESTRSGTDGTVSFEDAVRLTGVPGSYLTQLLDARTVAFEVIGGERRIPVSEIESYRERRAGAQLALRTAGLIRERSKQRRTS